jgi:hypothetical protein
MSDPIVIAGVVFGAAGFLLGIVEFLRRERLLRRMRPWEDRAATIARMGQEHLRNADNLRSRADEAERVVEEMAAASAALAEAKRKAGGRFRTGRPE